MLIDSPRFKPGDRDTWDRLEAFDHQIAQSPRLDTITATAADTLARFVDDGAGYVSTSWGKDSLVLCHILAMTRPQTPLVWIRTTPWENPDCLHVRDQFLATYDVNYIEIIHEATSPRWWENPTDYTGRERTSRGGFQEAARRYGDRHVSGIRGEESRIRGMVQARWGDAGPRACRPIGRWTAIDVFAYLHRHDLPIHPAYAMSFAGRMDRRWLRVAALGSVRGADKQKAEWELAYYPDIVSPQARERLAKKKDNE